MLIFIGLLYACTSVACYVAYARDKAAARANGRRTSERALLLLGLAGGWPGGLLAQQLLRHKTSKSGFLLLFWLSAAVNTALVLTVWKMQG